MNEPPTGPVPTPLHWVRVQLAAGASEAGLWDLSSDVPEARLVVGTAAGAGWRVRAPGVAEEAFELYWDGAMLWVSPPKGGTLTVDGERVVRWRQLPGRCRLQFGQAAMLVESSQSAGLALEAPVPGAEARAPSFESEDDVTVLQPGPFAREEVFGGGTLAEVLAPDVARPSPAPPEPAVDSPDPGTREIDIGAEGPTLRTPEAALRPYVGADPSLAELSAEETMVFDPEAGGLRAKSAPPPEPAPEPEPPPARPAALAENSALRKGFVTPPPAVTASKSERTFELPPLRTLALLGVTLVMSGVALSLASRRNAREALAAVAEARAANATRREAAAEAVEEQREAMRQAERSAREAATADVEAVSVELAPRLEAAEQALREGFRRRVPEDAEAQVAAARDRLVMETALAAFGAGDRRRARALLRWRATQRPDDRSAAALAEVVEAELLCELGRGRLPCAE